MTYADAIRAAKAHATVYPAADGRVHAYAGCAGPGTGPDVMTVGVLAAIPEPRIGGCLRHRWTAYRADLAGVQKLQDLQRIGPRPGLSGRGFPLS